MFHRANLNKKTLIGSENKQVADNWEAPKTVSDIQWALLNLAEVFALLWPYDNSIRILHRVLIRYDWAAGYGSSEKDRCRIIEDYVDKALCENASRAARGSPPLSFEQAKNRWRDAVEKEPAARSSNNADQNAARQSRNEHGPPPQQGGVEAAAVAPGAATVPTGQPGEAGRRGRRWRNIRVTKCATITT